MNLPAMPHFPRLLRPRALASASVSVATASAIAKRALDVGDVSDVARALFPPHGDPSTADYLLMAVIVSGVVFMIHAAREPVRPADELSRGGLRRVLKSMTRDDGAPFFSADAVDEKIDECMTSLLGQGVFGESEATKMLHSRWLRRHLNRLYRDVMERPEDSLHDVSGYVSWGAMIWAAGWLERPEMLRYVKKRMEWWKEHGAA